MALPLPSSPELKALAAKVAKMEAKGWTRERMAKTLNVSIRTLRTYLNEYMQKVDDDSVVKKVRTRLLHKPATIKELSDELGVPKKEIDKTISELKSSGHSINKYNDQFEISKTPIPQRELGDLPIYQSNDCGEYLFGFTSDNHIGSKYERLDVLEALYTEFERAGVDRVFNAGNWIDGEAKFNKFDIHVHGLEAQLDYFVKKYPQRKGIVTYAVAGDDHEGWYCQREGIDIGTHARNKMRNAGRNDFVYLGYIEAFVKLQHKRTKVENTLHLLHPGGGSAYADSYTVQKIVEGYEGGEKPAVMLAGHYHKLGYNYIRNVHAIQTGCTQDVTPFARKKKLRYAIGGGICRLRQDPLTGAIISCRVEIFGYFNKGFYNDRWSLSGSIVLPERVLNQN